MLQSEKRQIGEVELHVNRLPAFTELPLWSRVVRTLAPALVEADDQAQLHLLLMGSMAALPPSDLQDFVAELLETSVATVKAANGRQQLSLTDRSNLNLAFPDVPALLNAAVAAAEVRFGRFFGMLSASAPEKAESESTSPKTSAESGVSGSSISEGE